MSAPLSLPRYLLQIGSALPLRWDGHSPILFGLAERWLLERKGDQIRIRDLNRKPGFWSPLIELPIHELLGGKTLTVHGTPSFVLSLSELIEIKPVRWSDLNQIPSIHLSSAVAIPEEDRKFRTSLRRGGAALAILCLLVMIGKALEPEIKTDQRIIPQKFARIILSKPKETRKNLGGSAAAARAEARSVARAFQSKNVKENLHALFRGGITKYSIMATGKAITSLSRKMASTEALTGVGITKKAESLLGAGTPGVARIGATTGYAAGSGTQIQGQGHGQFEVGLNTSEAVVDEGLTREEVARVIHSHMSEIRYCYESGILRDPTLAGKLLVDFKINASGHVPNAGVMEASLKGTEVSQCLLGKLKGWKFPEPRGGVIVAVTYPFIFKSLSR